MFEADELCDRIAVIADGTIVAEGSPAMLKTHAAAQHVVEIEVFGAEPATLERLRAVPGVEAVSTEEREQAQLVIVQSSRGAELVDSLLRELDGTRLGRVVSREPTLEDAYVELVGRT